MFTEQELIERRKYLGASEAAAALGMSPFWTPVDLYLSKIGEGQPIETTIPLMVGTALEPVTLSLFERKTGLRVGNRQKVFVDEETPWRRCTIDGYVHAEKAIVEAKTSGDFRGWGDDETDIPVHYLYQIAHSFSCIPEAVCAYVPVLVGGRTFDVYKTYRDPELIALVREGEQAFMDKVKARTPPAPVNRDDVNALFPNGIKGAQVFASPEIEAMVMRHALAKAKAKEAQQEADAMALAITYYMKDAGELKRMTLTSTKNEVLATWNSTVSNRVDLDMLRTLYPAIAAECTKPSSSRRFLNKLKVSL